MPLGQILATQTVETIDADALEPIAQIFATTSIQTSDITTVVNVYIAVLASVVWTTMAFEGSSTVGASPMNTGCIIFAFINIGTVESAIAFITFVTVAIFEPMLYGA